MKIHTTPDKCNVKINDEIQEVQMKEMLSLAFTVRVRAHVYVFVRERERERSWVQR